MTNETNATPAASAISTPAIAPSAIAAETPPTPRELTQAERVLQKFGGARRLARILSALGETMNPSSIYKWTYPKSRGGTGGLIPTAAWRSVLMAARAEGIFITSEDIDPRSINSKKRIR